VFQAKLMKERLCFKPGLWMRGCVSSLTCYIQQASGSWATNNTNSKLSELALKLQKYTNSEIRALSEVWQKSDKPLKKSEVCQLFVRFLSEVWHKSDKALILKFVDFLFFACFLQQKLLCVTMLHCCYSESGLWNSQRIGLQDSQNLISHQQHPAVRHKHCNSHTLSTLAHSSQLTFFLQSEYLAMCSWIWVTCDAIAVPTCCLCCYCCSHLLLVLVLLFTSVACAAIAVHSCCLCCYCCSHMLLVLILLFTSVACAVIAVHACCLCCYCCSYLLLVWTAAHFLFKGQLGFKQHPFLK